MKILQKSFKMFEVETQLKYLEKYATDEKSGYEVVLDRLKEWDKVQCIVGAIHSRNGEDKSPQGNSVEPHFHWYVKMKDNKPTKMSTILSKLNGISVNESNYIQPKLEDPDSLGIGVAQIETIHGSYKDCDDYARHQDKKSLANPNKHQYTEEECSFFRWGITKEEVEQMTEKNDLSVYIPKEEKFWTQYGEQIEKGEITRARLVKDKTLVPDIDYLMYRTLFDKAFERHEKIALSKVNKDGMKMEVIYCYGMAGSGKTTYAKEYCKVRKLDFFVSGSSNDPFDGYLGEEAIILDDLRGSCFAFADLLKILDNNTRSQVKSRFYNKIVTAKVIIITSIMPIDELYSMFEKDDANKEPLEQLKRRCKTYLTFGEKSVRVNMWNKATGTYQRLCDVPNTWRTMYDEEEMTEEEKLAYAMDLMRGYGDALNDMADYVNEHKEELKDEQDKIDGWEQMNIEDMIDNPFT